MVYIVDDDCKISQIWLQMLYGRHHTWRFEAGATNRRASVLVMQLFEIWKLLKSVNHICGADHTLTET